MAPPTNGALKAKLPEFPSRSVAVLLRRLFAACRYAAVAAAAWAAYRGGVVIHALHESGELAARAGAWRAALGDTPAPPAAWLAAAVAAVVLAAWAALAWSRRGSRVYLLDFECYRPPASYWEVSYQRFMDGSRASGFFSAEALDFQEKILQKSALSQHTFFPQGFRFDPPQCGMVEARAEAEMVMFGAVAGLLEKTGLRPRQIDVLVTNCSLFNPTPSLAAMIINYFDMRSDIDSYNLGGMGCSAGVLAIGLARKLLRERGRGGYALVVSTENITQNWYRGNERSMLIPNTIFRMGGSAMLLTNKRSELRRAKYELEHVVRVHLGADKDAYECIFQKPDSDGTIGVELSKELVGVASKALTTNMTRLGPLVLPLSEKLCFAANWAARNLLRVRVAPYIPDFKQAFDHFCLHAGGRGVVEGLSRQLGLPPERMAPSANTLYWYGNTSSSTVWYSLAFVESVQGVARGDVVWQIGFGSGFKCNSVVWRALRPIKQMHWAWERIAGREGEAMQRMQRIAAETAAERVAKAAAAAEQQEREGGKAAHKQVAAASDLADAQAHLTAAAAAARGAAAAVANGRAGRTLRSGKVV